MRVVGEDVAAFWAAYDAVRALADSAAQVATFRTRYLDPGSPGVRAFVAARGYTAEEWVGAIRAYPRFWASIRSHTMAVAGTISAGLAPGLARLQALYPALRPATVSVTVGALRSGGTTQDAVVLIGAELAAGGPDVDVSEFTGGTRVFLDRYFAAQPRTTLVPLTLHEVVHTQQRGIGETVLARALREGSADLVTELATGVRVPLPYMTAGPARETALREAFREQMYTPRLGRWFYNQTSTDPAHVPDLGYYMGYAIARAYLARAIAGGADTAAVVRDLIELPFDDEAAVDRFLARSGYYAGHVGDGRERAALVRAVEARRPVVTRVVPIDADGMVDPSVTELRLEFSAPMAAPYNSLGYGPGGPAEWPVTGRVGFSPDGRAYTLRVALQPGRRYGFVLEAQESGGFRSAAAWDPLRPDTVTFTTRPAPR